MSSTNSNNTTNFKQIEEKDFKNFRLKRIIKENHNQSIQQVSICSKFSINEGGVNCANLVATVGANQLNVYDNEHIGNHLDLMSHMVIADDDQQDQETILSCCWLLPEQDAWLVLGGTEGNLHGVSLAFSQEIVRFQPHSDDITHISPHPNLTYYVLTTSKDNTIKLIDVENSQVLCSLATKATSLCFSQCGNVIYYGTPKGTIHQLLLHCDFNAMEDVSFQEGAWSFGEPELLYNGKDHGYAAIDYLYFTHNGQLLFKTNNSKLGCFDLSNNSIKYTTNIKNGCYYPSNFGVSQGEQFLSIGNELGNILIYKVEDGQCIQTLKHKRSSKPVKSCIFANNNTNIIYCSEGFIWRYDYIDDATLEEWAKFHK